MTELEEALTLRTSGADRAANADPRFESINGMFGGWTAAVLLRAVLEAAAGVGTPAAMTVNFLGKVEPGTEPVLRVDSVHAGRSLQHWHAHLLAADDLRPLATAMLIFAARVPTDGFLEPTMPEAPEPSTLEMFHPPGPQGERIDYRPISGHPPFGRSSTVSSAWVRDRTGRPLDVVQLAYLADQYAPRVFFISDGPRASATTTLSVHFHGSTEEIDAVGDGYLLNEATGTRASMSLAGQQARLWSPAGALLATTEQLAWYR